MRKVPKKRDLEFALVSVGLLVGSEAMMVALLILNVLCGDISCLRSGLTVFLARVSVSTDSDRDILWRWNYTLVVQPLVSNLEEIYYEVISFNSTAVIYPSAEPAT